MSLGCGDVGTPTADRFTVRDSAGLEIVEIPARTTAPGGLRVDSAVAWLEFSDGPAYRVAAGAFRSDGSAAVAHSGHRISVFSRSGEEVFTVGREGEGPGEYRSIGAASTIAGDSIVVFHDLHLITVLTPDGSFARRHRTPDLFNTGDNGVTASGAAFFIRSHGPAEAIARGIHGLASGTAVVYRFLARDGDADTIAVLPSTTWLVMGGGSASFAPFHATVQMAVGPGGVAAGWTGEYRIHEYDERGRAIRILHASTPPRAVTEEDRARWCEGHVSGDGDCAFNDLEDGRRVRREFPGTFPAYSDLLLTADGELWVQRYFDPDTEAGQQLWDAFPTDRLSRRTVSVPPDLRLLAVSGDRALAVHVDSLGVESVGLFAML